MSKYPDRTCKPGCGFSDPRYRGSGVYCMLHKEAREEGSRCHFISKREAKKLSKVNNQVTVIEPTGYYKGELDWTGEQGLILRVPGIPALCVRATSDIIFHDEEEGDQAYVLIGFWPEERPLGYG